MGRIRWDVILPTWEWLPRPARGGGGLSRIVRNSWQSSAYCRAFSIEIPVMPGRQSWAMEFRMGGISRYFLSFRACGLEERLFVE